MPRAVADHLTGARREFAEALAALYVAAGDPPLKKVAASASADRSRTGPITVQRVSDWRRGSRLPARFEAVVPLLRVLIAEARSREVKPPIDGLYDLRAWKSLWDAARATGDAGAPIPRIVGEEKGGCPYRGLEPYRREDESFFFGRDRSLAELTDLIELCRTTDPGIVMVTGPSGIGKSSLCRAGMTRASISDNATQSMVVTPGAHPIDALITAIPELASALELDDRDDVDLELSVRTVLDKFLGSLLSPNPTVLLLVDQLEELFGSCESALERSVFVRTLLTMSTHRGPDRELSFVVVGCLRADFYSSCLEYAPLRESLQKRNLILGPMTEDELRAAITGPARVHGVTLEQGLVDVVLRDAGATNEHSRGGSMLPLVSHAMAVVWSRRESGLLTLAAYHASGGVRGAIVDAAERAWATLDDAEKVAGEVMLMALVHIGPDIADTRRRRSRESLLALASDRQRGERVLAALTAERLLSIDRNTVELGHEAVLWAWPRLRKWIEVDRVAAPLRRRVEDDARSWVSEGRPDYLLYSGVRSTDARDLMDRSDKSVRQRDPVLVEFVEAGESRRRRARTVVRVSVSVIVVLVVVAAASLFFLDRTSRVVDAQQRDSEIERITALGDRLRGSDPSMAAQLDLVLAQMQPNDPGVQNRIIGDSMEPLAITLRGHTGDVYDVAVSPDGGMLASASYDRTVRLWDISDLDHPVSIGEPLTGHTGFVTSVAFSGDGNLLASTSDDGSVRLWDTSDRSKVRPVGSPLVGDGSTVFFAAFDPVAPIIATVGYDGMLRLWDVRDPSAGRLLGVPVVAGSGPVRTVAFSPDGSTVATGDAAGSFTLWDVRNPGAPAAAGLPTRAHSTVVHSIRFDPTGTMVATGGDDGQARLWDVTDRRTPQPVGAPLTGQSGALWSVEFAPDGRALSTASVDGTALIWDLTDAAAPTRSGPPLSTTAGSMFTATFVGGSSHVVTGGSDASLSLWTRPSTFLPGHHDRTIRPSFSADGHTLATGSTGGDVDLWTVDSSGVSTSIGRVSDPVGAGYDEVAMSPNGRMLAVSTTSNDRVTLWDISDPSRPLAQGAPLPVRTKYQSHLEFGSSGSVLVTGGDDDSVQLWDVSDPADAIPLGGTITGPSGWVTDAAIDASGDELVMSSADHSLWAFDISDVREPTRLFGPLEAHSSSINSVAFVGDGKMFLSADDDGSIMSWDNSDRLNPRMINTVARAHDSAVRTVDSSASSGAVISAGNDGTVRIWTADSVDGLQPDGAPIEVANGGRLRASYDANSTLTAIGGENGTVVVLDLSADSAASRICRDTLGFWTPESWSAYLPDRDFAPPCPG